MSDIKKDQAGEETTAPDALSVEDLDNVSGGAMREETVRADALRGENVRADILKR